MTRQLLTPELIFQAALRLVDAEGLETLTMRRLARDLGVAPMSLYSHVPNKDDLLVGVVNLATGEMALPAPDTLPWDALRQVTREFRRVALRHPNLVPLIMVRPPTGPAGLRTLEAALDALRRAGIPPTRVARAYRLSASFAIGFVSLEAGGFFQPPETRMPETRMAETAQPAPDGVGLAFEALPRISEAAPYLAEFDGDAEFEAGMDAIVDVLAGQVAPDT